MAQPAWKIYEERMERLRYGHALWEPSPTSQHTRIRIGDVGFIREGRFHFMFSAALPRGNRTPGVDVPSTFVELTVRDGETQADQPRAPGCVGAMTYRRVVAGLRLSFTEPVIKSLEPGLNFSVEHTGESGAALTTRHESYNEDAQLDMRFRKYTKLHYESWVEFARLKEYGENLRPVLVSGFDMTKDFAMMAYSNSNTSVQAGADCHTPMFGSASVSTEFTWRTVCAPHFKDGPKERRPPGLRPSQAGAGTPPTEYNQCIFVRYYTMRSEFGIFPRVIRAAAGPKDLGSGENRGETFPELTVRSGAGPVSAERDPREQWSLATDDTGPEPDMVIRNEPYDEGRDSWDIVADYVLQNSNAKRVLMHHKDLAGILVMGDETDISSLLAKHKPTIVVDEDGVGGIISGEGALSSQAATMGSPPDESRDESVPGSPYADRSLIAPDDTERTSTKFPEELYELLHDTQRLAALKVAPEGELTLLIGHLDNMLDGLDPAGQPFRKCLHILQKLCASKMMLPSSYEVSGKLSFNSTDAIAYGGFCDVYDGSLDLERVCVKRLRVSAAGDRALTKRSLCKEAVVWKHLDHPNIVPFKGVTFDPFQLVSEWIPGGELKEYISRGSTQANLIGLLLGVAKGLGYLHSRNVIHGDLKGANILIDANDNPRIVDFGLSTIARDSDSIANTSGLLGATARFTAPEILKGLGHSKASDVFAFGMVVIEAFTGRVPFSGCISFKAMTNILAGIHPERPIHPGFTDQLWTLTRQCWEEKPDDRPNIDSVIEQLNACLVQHLTCTQPAEPHGCEIPQASPPSPSLDEATSSSLLPSLPQAPAYFFGRDATLEDLLNLAERSASVLLHGAGGMGKTTIALTLLYHHQILNTFGNHRYFVRCGNLEDSLDGFLGRLSDAIGAPEPMDLAQLRSRLEASPCLLVLDGIDSIIDPRSSGAAEIASTIEEFGRCPKVCLLATSRIKAKIPGFRRIKVSTLSEDAARSTFHSHCSLGRSVVVDKILEELDFHPLSITLLASAVSENGWSESALVEAWNNGKTSMLSASARESLEDTIESTLRTPTIRELGTTARETLEAIADYPKGVKEVYLLTIFPEIKGIGDTVNVLCKFSLMYREEGFIKMIAPFRLYFQYTRHHSTNSGDDASVIKKVRSVKVLLEKLSDFLHVTGTNRPNRARMGLQPRSLPAVKGR